MTVNNVTTNSGPITFTAAGDIANIITGASVSGVGKGISGAFSGLITNDGYIFGSSIGIQIGVTGSNTEIYNGIHGSIVGSGGGEGLLLSGTLSVINYGQIFCAGTSGWGLGSDAGSTGTIVNYGAIGAATSSGGTGVHLGGTSMTLVNYGTISGQYAIVSYDLNGDNIVNAGVLKGDVQLTGAATIFNSSAGRVDGTIFCGSGGSTIIAGTTGGSVVGGTGTDILYANRTQAAVANAAQTTLDGNRGNNALYGDGAYTTFVGGSAAGGTNQIWGGASEMVAAPGYSNNTLTFETATHGVYVDLLTGHNAYLSTGTNWTGSGVFEDAIAATGGGLSTVPNVIGTTWNDILIADNGVDSLTGGGRADQLIAGTGAASQDTFVYKVWGDSNTTSGYDTIVGFKRGVDRIDVSAFMQANGLGPNSIAIFTNGASNTVYVEKTAGTFNAATDLALIVNTSTAGGLNVAKDFIL